MAVTLDPEPTSLTCSLCGADVDDAGYLPATEQNGTYRPLTDDACCGSCGFNEVGLMGCAPELDDLKDGAEGVLLYVERTADGFDVVSVKG